MGVCRARFYVCKAVVAAFCILPLLLLLLPVPLLQLVLRNGRLSLKSTMLAAELPNDKAISAGGAA